MTTRLVSPSTIVAALCLATMPVTRIGAQQPPGPPARELARLGGPAAVADSIAALVTTRRHAGMRFGRLDDVAGDLARGYAAVRWSPLWLDGSRPTRQARDVVARLTRADDVGLPAADFDAEQLAAAVRALDDGALSGAALAGPAARFDVMLSANVVRFVHALQFGRISPRAAHAALELSRESFAGDRVLRDVAGATDPVGRIADAEPHYEGYRRLVAMLRRYRTLARDSSLAPLPPLPARVLRPGMSWDGTGALRALLVALQDLAPAPAPAPDARYEGVLVDGVRRFQARHGLAADGEIGPATFERLARPWESRVRQIELALERWRWLPRAFPQPPLIVNIPEFRLHVLEVLNEDSAAGFDIDVAVGRAFRTSTPVFAAHLTHLIFSPYWDVPPSIARNEIRPLAVRDPGYLERNAFQLLAGPGDDARVLPLTTANAARIGRDGVRVRQLPGARNSLGRVKFVFPNRFNVYMHDTPVRETFGRPRRDVSHGCIRLSDPVRLAGWLLRDRPEWTPEAMAAAMARSRPLRVDLGVRIPVLVVYGTAIATREGEARFLDDVYGHDRRLERLLAQGFPYPR